MLETKRNQKLTNSQIATISYLRGHKIPVIVIARALRELQGVALSTTYYHVSKNELSDRMQKKANIVCMIKQGYNTKQIADMLGESLEYINKIYAR